jgi:hypothetical protein
MFDFKLELSSSRCFADAFNDCQKTTFRARHAAK